ncbi:MAG: fimbrillin family protein [Alistipes sp.]|jgi:hypothetical protein|nr:fimbrillin family protein [Alistipes sp.]
MKKILSLVALAGAVFASCERTPETPPPPQPGHPVAATFTSRIAGMDHTRVADDRWETGDKIGIFMIPAGESISLADYENVEAAVSSSGEVTPAEQMNYPEAGEVDFVAYHPYNAELTNHPDMGLILPVDVSSDGQTLPVEVLYSDNLTGQAATESAVDLNFDYVLTKIVMTVRASAESNLDEAAFASMGVAIGGMPTRGAKVLETGEVLFMEGSEAEVVMRKVGNTATTVIFEALVLPVAEPRTTFTFTVNGEDYTTPTVTDGYQAGMQYNLGYTLDLTNPSEAVFLSAGTSITPRGEVTRDYTFSNGPAMTLTTAQLGGFTMLLYVSGSGTATFDWGDGSEPTTVTMPEFGSPALEVRHSFTGSTPYEVVVEGEVAHLTGDNNSIGGFDGSRNPGLRELFLNNNKLTTLDVGANTSLVKLSCGQNALRALDVSALTQLEELSCFINLIESLNLEGNPALTYLDCDNNPLRSLDVSANAALTFLSCGMNGLLTEIDVTANTELTSFRCSATALTAIDVSRNAKLTELICNMIPELTELDLENNTELTFLNCFGNPKLTTLDLTGTAKLTSLSCNDNALESLDVSGLAALEVLVCGNNKIAELDVSANTALKQLSCIGNTLIENLDVSNNTALTLLNINNNPQLFVDVTNLTALMNMYCDNNRYTTEQIDALFGMLNDTQGRKTIYIRGNPNTMYANYDIAINKGWTVRDY